MRRAICLFLLVVPGVAIADGTPPAGWRFPTEADYKDAWVEYRDRFPVPFHVSADFDGDGIVDHAWILIRREGNGFGLFVFFGSRKGNPHVVEVFAYDECCAQSYGTSAYPTLRS